MAASKKIRQLSHEPLQAVYAMVVAIWGLSLGGCSDHHSAPNSTVAIEAVQGTADEVCRRIEELGGRYKLDESGRVWALDFKRCPLSDGDLELLRLMPEIRTMTLRGIAVVKGKLSDEGLKPIESLKELRRLDLSANQFHGNLECLAGLPELEYLNLEGNPFDDAAAPAIQSLPCLETLELSQTKFSGKAIAAMAQIPTLKRLDIGYTSATGRLSPVELKAVCSSSIEELGYGFNESKDDIAVLGGLKRLRKWSIGFGRVPVNRLAAFANVDQLDTIPIVFHGSDCSAETEAAFRSMHGLKQVYIAGKGDCPLPILSALESLPQLEELKLSGVDNVALSHIPPLKALRKLDLSHTPVGSDVGLRPLSAIASLRELNLRADAVTPAGLESLSRCSQLERLSFSLFETVEIVPAQNGKGKLYKNAKHRDVGFRARDLAPVLQRTHLKSLDLSDLGFGDEALAEVAAAPQIEELAISNSPVTDAGFMKLQSLEHLRAINISGTSVSYHAAEALWEARDQECAISDNWCCGCMAFPNLREEAQKKSHEPVR